MKNLFLIFLITLSGNVFSQKRPDSFGFGKEGREKIVQMKLTYVKDNLGLTDGELTKFMPVYEANLKLEETLRHKHKKLMRELRDKYQSMDDTELEKALAEELELDRQMQAMRESQLEEYKKLIPLKKIVELKIVEKNFNRLMMEELRQRKGTFPSPER